MASLGHIAVGMAAARAYGARPAAQRASLGAMAFWSALSFLPDADVIGFPLGIRYADEWGHRGATHSLVFSLALGAAIGLAAPLVRRPALRTGMLASVVLASHALLDTLTNGGLGCALFWPFDLTRYFAPWNPIPVSPIGLAFFSPYGFIVTMSELAIFAPLLWYALSGGATGHRRTLLARARWPLLAIWLIAVWLIGSTDPVRDAVIGRMMSDDTEFTPGFSEAAYRTVTAGEPQSAVRERLGAPLREALQYGDLPDSCAFVMMDADAVAFARPPDACRSHGIHAGVSRTDVLRILGAPPETCWIYTRSRGHAYYRLRAVCFAGDRVSMLVQRMYRD